PTAPSLRKSRRDVEPSEPWLRAMCPSPGRPMWRSGPSMRVTICRNADRVKSEALLAPPDGAVYRTAVRFADPRFEPIWAKVRDETREVHIVGGHHPDWPFEYYERMIQAIHAAHLAVQIKAFTAAEIDYFWRRWKIEPKDALGRLKAAGLQSMPGGGAEIFSPRLAKLLKYTGKADPERWCEIHGIAHALGIRTNATMLYGHVETLPERVDHLLRLRDQQDASGGFVTFVPLAYQTAATKLVARQ